MKPLEDNQAGFTAEGTGSARIGIGGGILSNELTRCENAGFKITARTNLTINENWDLTPSTSVEVHISRCSLNVQDTLLRGASIGGELIKQALNDFVFARLIENQLPGRLTPILDNVIAKSYRTKFNGTWGNLQAPIFT